MSVLEMQRDLRGQSENLAKFSGKLVSRNEDEDKPQRLKDRNHSKNAHIKY